MPKKILFESAVHQFLSAASRVHTGLEGASAGQAQDFRRWLNQLELAPAHAGQLRIAWTTPVRGEHMLELRGAQFYTRGDTAVHVQRQAALGLADDDHVMQANRAFFDEAVRRVISEARVLDDATLARAVTGTSRDAAARIATEEAFHDDWAKHENIADIDVRRRNEACTAPEMRHLRAALGDLRGKTLLDVGCGLGEASVYFALQGATVTATDLSPQMCAVAQQLAARHQVTIATHVSAAEDLGLGRRQFDVIYTGNTLHHVDLEPTLDRLLPHLKPDGTFVSWDPVAYNPLINLYRRMATKVRTPDEHPLRLRDIRAITRRFARVEVRWFWLCTLLIFVWMAAVQRRSPNRERYWKTVIDEADRWERIYRPLERCDRFLLRWIPPLRPLCWNVAIVARDPRPLFRHD